MTTVADRPGNPVLTEGAQLAELCTTDAAREAGAAAAHAGLLDAAWGGNRKPDTIAALVAEGTVASHLLAVDLSRVLADLHAEAAAAASAAHGSSAAAREALARARRAGREVAAARADALENGLDPDGEPAVRRRRGDAVLQGVALAGLAAADTFVTAPALDQLGLLDAPLVPGLAWTDERHVVAFFLVLSMLGIAHLAGTRLPAAARLAGRRLRARSDAARASRTSSTPDKE